MGEPHVDEDWAAGQLEKAGLSEEARAIVTALILSWNSSTDQANLQETERAAEAFRQLALGYSLTPDTPDEIWVPVLMGTIQRGDTVRVKSDAYSGASGKVHNGRVGRVVGARSGDVIFKSTDNVAPALEGTHYRPDLLEKRIR
jgi:hypothetical protein